MRAYVLTAAVLGAALAGGTVAWNVQAWRMSSEISELRANHATALATAVQAERDKQSRHAVALEKEAQDAAKREEAAAADADSARDAGERLRKQLALARATACRAPAIAPGGAPTQTPDSVLADVQSRADAAAETIARYADAARNAGLACERSADALRR